MIPAFIPQWVVDLGTFAGYLATIALMVAVIGWLRNVRDKRRREAALREEWQEAFNQREREANRRRGLDAIVAGRR